jgi:hypothetical protein
MMVSAIIGRQLPVVLVFIGTLLGLVEFFLPELVAVGAAVSALTNIGVIVIAFALFIVVFNIAMAYGRKIARRETEWYYAVWTLVFFALYTVVGLLPPIATHEYFTWIYTNFHRTISSTMMGILAFSIVGGAIRAFRARTLEAVVLMIAYLFTLMYIAPIGEVIHPILPQVGQWFIDVPNTAGNRAILMCVAIGTIAMGLRQMVGLERAYLGIFEE